MAIVDSPLASTISPTYDSRMRVWMLRVAGSHPERLLTVTHRTVPGTMTDSLRSGGQGGH
ncbi:hypothetical protein GCM10022251_13810 [Phytohabitans flavus]